MSQINLEPLPYYQFSHNPSYSELSAYSYKTVPNKKINFHYPFIVINYALIDAPLEDVAIVEASDEGDDKHTHLSHHEFYKPPYFAKQLYYLNDLPNFETCIFFPSIHQKGMVDTKVALNVSNIKSVTDAQTSLSTQSPTNLDLPVAISKPDIKNNLEGRGNIESKHTNNNRSMEKEPIVESREAYQESLNHKEINQETLEQKKLTKEVKSDSEKSEDGINEEEKKREIKESQLESYKHFLATQQNNIKIDYQGIRVQIEANALPSRMYFIMNALSAIIASYGLVINSSAVVIGAMLVAMMLGPITGVALALIDYRTPFLRKSLFTVLAGGVLVIVIGFIVGLLHQDTPLTNEILSRTQPTSMDLMIALAGGTAGAYAMISPHLSVAVVGVAVATALVPPLASSGILLAQGRISLGIGALLLAVTNIIAIQFTNALVLWFAGFRRLVKDDYKTSNFIAFCRRNTVPLILLIGIAGYLTYNFNIITKQQMFEAEVKKTINAHFNDSDNILTTAQFVERENYQIVRAVIRGEKQPSVQDTQSIESDVDELINESYPNYKPVRIQIRYLPVVVINSDPSNEDNISKTDAEILMQN